MNPEAPRMKDRLDVFPLEDGAVAYDASTDRIHFLNDSAWVILEMCDGSRTPEEMALELARLAGLPEPPRRQVEEALAGFREQGILS